MIPAPPPESEPAIVSAVGVLDAIAVILMRPVRGIPAL
jgi:hypothetical protein